jgi:hypothetical protein
MRFADTFGRRFFQPLLVVWVLACDGSGGTNSSERLVERGVASPGCYAITGATGFPEGTADLYLPTGFRLRPRIAHEDGHIYGYDVEFLNVPMNYRPLNRTAEGEIVPPDSLIIRWGVVYRLQTRSEGTLSGIARWDADEAPLGPIEARLAECP